MKTLKAIINFFKKKEVHIWAAIMAGVIVVAFSIMSWIMISDKIVFGQIKTGETTFEFMPHMDYIDTITITSENDKLSQSTVQFNNNMIGGKYDEVVFKSEAKAVSDIRNALDQGRKTNSFLQFFTGGASGDERINPMYISSLKFEEESQGYSIKIVFATPQFVLNRDSSSSPWRLEKYDPAYTQPVNSETGVFCGQKLDDYRTSLVTAIRIPLGGVRNVVTKQTWYLSVGSSENNNTSGISYTFTTYGNYYKLLKYVKSIDDDFLL